MSSVAYSKFRNVFDFACSVGFIMNVFIQPTQVQQILQVAAEPRYC